MNRLDYPFGFRVVGPVSEERRLVDAPAAFLAHAGCDPRAEPNREVYLSAFRFGGEFRDYLNKHKTTKGFAGSCWSPWLWFDIDRANDLETALFDTRKLMGFTLERYRKLDVDDVLVFFSGGKGYHLGVPLTHNPDPSSMFHLIARCLAEGLADGAGVRIDTAIYDRVRCFRAPNSCHPRTGLYKRRLSFNEVMFLSAARLAELARVPVLFDVPVVRNVIDEIKNDWQEATQFLEQKRVGQSRRLQTPHERLQRDTLDFIRNGAEEGERHPRLFRAAGNLREFNASPALIDALLTEAALDSGLSPSEVARQIRCGIEHADRQLAQGERTEGGEK